MEILLIRHGQSESNARLTTELDSKLTPLGEKQAQATAEYLVDGKILRDPHQAQIFVSPFRRTLQTCRPLAERAGVKSHAFPDMCEHFAASNLAYSAFTGLTQAQIEREFPYIVEDSLVACEGPWWPSELETVQSIYRRAERVRDSIYSRFAGTDTQVVIFSHAEPIGRLIESLQRVPPAEGWPPWSENCGVSRLIVGSPSEPAKLVILNDVSHLRRLDIVSPVNP